MICDALYYMRTEGVHLENKVNIRSKSSSLLGRQLCICGNRDCGVRRHSHHPSNQGLNAKQAGTESPHLGIHGRRGFGHNDGVYDFARRVPLRSFRVHRYQAHRNVQHSGTPNSISRILTHNSWRSCCTQFPCS